MQTCCSSAIHFHMHILLLQNAHIYLYIVFTFIFALEVLAIIRILPQPMLSVIINHQDELFTLFWYWNPSASTCFPYSIEFVGLFLFSPTSPSTQEKYGRSFRSLNMSCHRPRFGRYPGFSAMLPPEAEMWTDQELDVGRLDD